ncbi:FecCD family ABC transporter permease [Myroides pelagicus]|uniref:Iron chelate uptake ABC transporter family permease subunit n=1 Tax=Myroides pelagicus TaxID=270914 RepID=A0A7K1GNR2_9FLAO|nr:iron ABC transporter permease [Myroides pelagicus]MEC4114556.1 iron ABC transporter permease [Myroides pelagicus]MTH30179.1 iron chelate uptake ABC transporter family permease subunit [Myroides pelagicus]
MKERVILSCLVLTVLVIFIANISTGSISIPFTKVIAILSGNEDVKNAWRYIVLDYRLPKAIVAILVGVALSISGLLMQTLFRNPMAESYVLGISSGAGLGVACLILGSSFLPIGLRFLLTSSYAIAVVSILGSFFLLLLILMVSTKVKSTTTLLIVGIMFGSFANAAVSILTFFGSAEEIKKFIFWSMGSLGNLTMEVIGLFTVIVIVGLFGALYLARELDALLLGDNYASSMGVDVKRTRNQIVLVTALLAGVSTAFVGPIAFIGLAVPHMTRLLFGINQHSKLIVYSAILGSGLMLICDLLTQLNGDQYLLPINAITSMFGAPIVVWLLLKNKAYL